MITGCGNASSTASDVPDGRIGVGIEAGARVVELPGLLAGVVEYRLPFEDGGIQQLRGYLTVEIRSAVERAGGSSGS